VFRPKNSGAAFDLKKCQRLKIAEKSIVDFVAFNLRDLTEAFDQAVARAVDVRNVSRQLSVLIFEQKENSTQSEANTCSASSAGIGCTRQFKRS
jgi:uncharacterized protein YcgI (DUF1989 family)